MLPGASSLSHACHQLNFCKVLATSKVRLQPVERRPSLLQRGVRQERDAAGAGSLAMHRFLCLCKLALLIC